MKTFEQFRRELADAVTVAINQGVVIHDVSRADLVGRCRCPLGVRTRVRHPIDRVAAQAWGISSQSAFAFAEGFDGDPIGSYREHYEYFALGRLYRQRFVEGK